LQSFGFHDDAPQTVQGVGDASRYVSGRGAFRTPNVAFNFCEFADLRDEKCGNRSVIELLT
jgi:hypothetical protein